MALDARLLLLYADGECSAQEASQVESTLRSDRHCRRRYAQILRRRLMLAELCSEERRLPVVVVADDSTGKAGIETDSLRRSWFAAAVAAAALIAAVIGVLTALHFDGDDSEAPAAYVISGSEADSAREQVAYGRELRACGEEEINLLLSDRSVVNLAPRAAVVFDAPRRLSLAAGALRVVCRKDPQRKFVVSAGDSTVTALGTEFSVSVADSSESGGHVPRLADEAKEVSAVSNLVKVVVFSGAVLLANRAGGVRLEAGEKGLAGKGLKPEKVEGRGQDGDRGAGKAESPDRGRGEEHGMKNCDLEKLGAYVKELHARGVKGKELAEAVRARANELKKQKQARNAARGKRRGQGEGKQHRHKHGGGEGDGEGKGKGKMHQNRHQRGKGSADGSGNRNRHKHGGGEGEGKGNMHQNRNQHGNGSGGGSGNRHQHKHGGGGAQDEGKQRRQRKGKGGGRGRREQKRGGDQPPAAPEGDGEAEEEEAVF